VIGGDGSIIPFEVTGAGGVNDDAVGGIVYSVRSCHDDDLLTEVFRGVASYQPVANAADPLVRRLALPPLRLSAAIFEQYGDGSSRCVSATDTTMATLPASATGCVPWGGLVTEPTQVPFDVLSADIAERLRSAGLRSCFHAGAHAPDHEVTLRVVACAEDEHTSAQGALALIAQTRDLLAIVAQKAYNDRMIANNATRDDLTGLPTRVGLVHRFERAASSGEECALLFVDLDGFKRINDEQGHLIGDRVLASVAERLVRVIRPDDFVSRIGGDEFAVLLTDARGRLGPEAVESVARRVVDALNAPISIDGRQIPLAASVGVARSVDDDLDELMIAADGAMYRAKRDGGGRHFIEPVSMHPSGRPRATLDA
jgi:diguanylate cyclase (GGDEF)-like protein